MLSELLLLVVFEIMSVVPVEVPIGLVGMLSVELMGGSVVGTVLLVVVVGGVMLLLHWALRMAPEGGRRPNNHNRMAPAGLPANLSIISMWVASAAAQARCLPFLRCPFSCLCPQA